MKCYFKILFVLNVLIFTSCEVEQNISPEKGTDEVVKFDDQKIQTQSRNSFPIDGDYMLASLVQGSYCGQNPDYSSGNFYTVYATSGMVKDYDRELHVGIYKIINGQNSIVDAKILTVPAYSNNSVNVAVFQHATSVLGSLKVKIFTVLNGQQEITDQFLLHETSSLVSNCYASLTSFSCVGSLDISEGPFLGSGKPNLQDDDGDGLCNSIDPDDDNDGIPDISE